MKKVLEIQRKKCKVHGVTDHVISISKDGTRFRCKKCRVMSVTKRRRNIKEILVQEAGGCCKICGYKKCNAGLAFHHIKPSNKKYILSTGCRTLALDTYRKEAAKCILLCHNCHAEFHAGIIKIPSP